MKQILSLRPPAFGLDVSDRSVKLVMLEKAGNGLRAAAFADRPLPEGLIHEGEIKDEGALSGEVSRLLKSARVPGTRAVVSLPEERGFLQVIQLPLMGKEEVESAARFEAENYIPFPLETVELDYDILPGPPDADHLDVLLAAHPRVLVESYVSTLARAGMTPVVLEPEPLAASRAVVPSSEEGSMLVADLGDTHTGLSVYAKGAVRFATAIPVSGHMLTEAVAAAFGVEASEAERLKRAHGVRGGKGSDERKVFEALVPPLTDLLEQMRKYLAYYESHEFHQHLPEGEGSVRRILLCGGGALLPGLPSFFSSQLESVSAELADPWVNILGSPPEEIPPVSFADSLRFSTALGLALRGIRLESDIHG